MKNDRTGRGGGWLKKVRSGRIPGQLVIQLTDNCNARCPQCGMRVTETFRRTTLDTDAVKQILAQAAAAGIQAVSFTGGEPFLNTDALMTLIVHAGAVGIPFIRTGTNGFLFMGHEKSGFRKRIIALAKTMAATPLRNFWISIDSADPRTHEEMRGLPGVMAGIRKALPIFHEHGIYPSANLGLNRNIGGVAGPCATRSLNIACKADEEHFYNGFRAALCRFFETVSAMGFTMVNMCYPMSIDATEREAGLNPVYNATATENIVRFTHPEKAMLFRALLHTVPKYRGRMRIFTPLSALLALYRQYRFPLSAHGNLPHGVCHGGVDFFFINARDGNTYPCGYRGDENMGTLLNAVNTCRVKKADCRRCDWECFRDPSVLFGPLHDFFSRPLTLLRNIMADPFFHRVWLSDLSYYRACGWFDGRLAMDCSRNRSGLYRRFQNGVSADSRYGSATVRLEDSLAEN